MATHETAKRPAGKMGEAVLRTDEDELRRILGGTFGVNEDTVGLETRFLEDLEFDSLDFVELGVCSEGWWGIEFGEDEDFEKLVTFGAWIRRVREVRGVAAGLPVEV